MKWHGLFLLAFALSSSAYAKDPFACMYSGNVPSKGIFTFEIWRAADSGKDTSFRLCEISGRAFVLVKVKTHGVFKVRTIDLDAEQLAKIKGLYEEAFGANFKDETFGVDGSTWCLEANRMNYLKACFFTPTSDTRARGLERFVDLGTALWELAQFKSSNGKLY